MRKKLFFFALNPWCNSEVNARFIEYNKYIISVILNLTINRIMVKLIIFKYILLKTVSVFKKIWRKHKASF